MPMDMNQPSIRVRTILEEAQCKAVIVAGPLANAELEQALTNLALLTLDATPLEPQTLFAPLRQLFSNMQGEASDEAYVIMTSGSTGKPKGVVMSHGAAMNTIDDLLTRWACTAEDVFFGLANLNFDLSVFDMFACLAVGAHLVLPSGKTDVDEWINLVEKYGVTVWNSVPMHMQMVLAALQDEVEGGQGEAIEADSLSTLRICLLSGDKVPVAVVQSLVKNLEGLQVYNGGGATEAGIWSILFPIAELNPKATFVPCGKPMNRQQFHILDADMQPCPTWVAGEMFISGDSLATCYTDANLTRQSFLTAPHLISGRLYRTGDYGRYLDSGYIQFLGRRDGQVKVRGHRIETGEIERTLEAVPGVKEGVVVLDESSQDRAMLHAFVTMDGQDGENGRAEEAAVMDALGRRLPRYMVPSSVRIIDTLPLSANGKVDRNALAVGLDVISKRREGEVKGDDGDGDGEFYDADSDLGGEAVGARACLRTIAVEAPVDDLESSLCDMWASVLRVDAQTIGRHDDFFIIGGNSLSAIRVFTTIKRRYKVRIDVALALSSPTISSTADMLRAKGVK